MPIGAFFTWAGGNTITAARLNRVEQFAPNIVRVLLVAGGGGGSSSSTLRDRTGGGGGGGVAEYLITIGNGDEWTVTIGAGGAAGANGTESKIVNAAYGTRSVQGGGFGAASGAGGNGGCGGGGGGNYGVGGAGNSGEGCHGGDGAEIYKSTGSSFVGGGGGGAGGNGEQNWFKETAFDINTVTPYARCKGGNGFYWAVTGLHYGGGGANGVVGARGGVGGGASGPTAIPGNGLNGDNEAGGGGSGCASSGASQTGGQGGSGRIIFAYPGTTSSDVRHSVTGSPPTRSLSSNGWIIQEFNTTGQKFIWTGN